MTAFAPIRSLADRPGTEAADEFQLPLPGLYADLELGAGSLRLPDEFLAQSGLVQIKLLAAWQRSLIRYRRAALERLADELTRGSPGLSESERQALLRRACASLHLDCPDDATGIGQAG